jgi:hypothetical protein
MKGCDMDLYTKSILTIIAIAVSAIAIKLFMLQMPPPPPTFGDFAALRFKGQTAAAEFFNRIPLVRIQGGNVDVSGNVSIDR